MDLQLKGQVVVVSGGAKGIGEAVVRSFAAEGAIPVVVDRNAEAGQALVAELSSAGAAASFAQADLCVEDQCRAAIESAVASHGRIDVLVNNAGYNDARDLAQPPSAFRQSLEANLVSAYALTHFAAPHLKRARGAIVNVGSKVAETGQGSTSGYAAAKGAINALTREWAVALAADGVRVNAVLPAECLTPQYEAFFATQPDPVGTQKAIGALVPLEQRLTKPQEIADMIVFLASPRSSHTTAQIVFVDGGYTHLDRAYSHDHSKWS